jgi:hypothetical protein
MNKIVLSLIAGLALVSPAFAGSPEPAAATCCPSSVDLFRAHEFQADVYGAYSVKTGGGDHNNDKDGFGGGLSFGYYFTRVVGVRVDTSLVESNGGLWQIGGDLLLRAPIDTAHIAPYGIIGAGSEIHGGSGDLYLRAGLGIEARITAKVGVFTEATYNWVDSASDRVLIKAGVRFAF